MIQSIQRNVDIREIRITLIRILISGTVNKVSPHKAMMKFHISKEL